ncbi:IscR-regulated protein YhgI [Mycobacterium basiliense]|uniref:IscR-regulated protein YhgI n=1 Tax=Mycobacterium basiliense TaxID=2094119 RepID=A0A447GCE0_9MYCO|nr:NifU family protein [Mycobacterium basiliense]VDM88132.1 IscR-regulated protein YhgI [Mycobacterium basiliense]
MADRPESPPSDAQWRTAGDRIQTLLDACAAGGAAAHDRAQQLVREVVGLYGAGLERIMGSLHDPALAERLAADDLVASLLLVHGLHPHDLHRRVSDALQRVRPYLGSHGGDVDLLAVSEETDGAGVLLAFTGSCKSCPSSAVTLELAVQDAIWAAAPEVTSIEVVAAPSQPTAVNTSAMIPAESLLAQIHRDGSHGSASGRGATTWHPVPELAELRAGEVGGFAVGGTGGTIGTNVLACRVGEETFAYRDRCPVCADSLAGATLNDALLRCPRCQRQFDVVHAGIGAHDCKDHLDPLPLLTRDGVLSVALREALGTPA